MTAATTTHLNFTGNARAALEFYAAAFRGQAIIRTYGDFGMPAEASGSDLVVWGLAAAENGFQVMAYDILGAPARPAPSTRRENGVTITDQPFFVSVRGDSLEEVQGYWDGLADGATVIEPLAASAWSAGFGMLADRFGVTWVLDVAEG
ncbi:MAG: VOC family protein [Micrococcales bacterium]|nr:VOC family protein [Micrococcales bacterium]